MASEASTATLPGFSPAAGPGAAPPPAALFARLWDTSAAVIGLSATAVLVRRATGRAVGLSPGLAGIAVERLGLGYRYRLPPSWSDPGDRAGAEALRALLEELGPLLAEMTGPVVLRRLAAEPALRAAGLATDDDVARWLGGG